MLHPRIARDLYPLAQELGGNAWARNVLEAELKRIRAERLAASRPPVPSFHFTAAAIEPWAAPK